MPLVIADRVRETSTTVGTGTLTLDGAVASYQSFSAIGNGNTVYYTIVNQSANEWEVGIGTYTASGTTLSRDTVLSSSNSGSLVNFSAGTKDVWGDYPAGKAVTTDTLAYPPAIGGTTPAAATFTTLTATGQTSLGGAAGSESFRVNTSQVSGAYLGLTTETPGNSVFRMVGTNVGVAFVSAGTGAFSWSTGSSASTTQFRIAHTASAVNYVQVTGSATGANPLISVQGSDATRGLGLASRGTGNINLLANGGTTTSFQASCVGASVNYFQTLATATSQPPIFSAQGSDTNISMVLQPKGTGGISLSTGSTGTNLVNGTSVTAITRTAAGSNYTSAPSVVISAPTTAGGVQATATCTINLGSFAVVSGGTGYTVGDTLTLSGGTFTAQAQVQVSTVSAGVITAVTTVSNGAYTVAPSSPASVTGGTGTGATISFNGGVTSNGFTITNAGSGYVEQPTVTFSGGGGSGAAAYATVGSGTTVRSLGSTMSFVTPGGEQVRVTESAGTAVNYVGLTGAVATGSPLISSAGSDTNINLVYVTKGTGEHRFATNNSGSTTQLRIAHTASAVNYVQVTGAATGQLARVTAQGSDTNVGLLMSMKGWSSIQFWGANQIFQMGQTTATPANYLQTLATASGSGPSVNVVGTDTNIDLNLTTKGTGALSVNTGGGTQFQVRDLTSANRYIQATGGISGSTSPSIGAAGGATGLSVYASGFSPISFLTNGAGGQQFNIAHTASAVNFVQVTGSATGAAVQISAQGSDTNIPLVVQPKGTGALQAQLADSATTGGNARGANAVDWQTLRNNAGSVASGTTSVISGGGFNTASGQNTFVGGGAYNNASGYNVTIAGGQANAASQRYAGILSGYGNSALGYFNIIVGGAANSGTANSAVTTQATTSVTSGSTAVTLSGSNASIKVGQLISGTGIVAFPETYVAAISGTSLTLSQAASATGTPTLSFFTPHGVVVGGGNNQATGAYSFIGGGGDAGTASQRNVASGDWSVVGGGQQNTASGVGSVVCGGGAWAGSTTGNVASGGVSFVGGGGTNVASGAGSVVTGGWNNSANATYSSVVSGRSGTTRSIVGNTVMPASNIPISTNQGTSQAALLVLGKQTTDATATVLVSDSNAAGTTNQVILPNNSAYYFKGSVIANVTGAANGAAWSIEGAIMRGANAASTVLIDTPSVNRVAASSGATAWTVSVTADTTNGGLAVTVTGAAATTIRWVAKLETTEVTF